MSLRSRKLVGTFALLILVITWMLLAMAVAQFPVIKASGLVEVIYYAVAGLGWILPAMPLIRWMSSRPGERPQKS